MPAPREDVHLGGPVGVRPVGVEALHVGQQDECVGADQERAVAVRELRKLGRRAPRRDAAPAGGRLAGLSARESEVAALVADGATNQAVADALFLSVKTVESHLRNIFAKTGVSSREALAATVREQG